MTKTISDYEELRSFLANEAGVPNVRVSLSDETNTTDIGIKRTIIAKFRQTGPMAANEAVEEARKYLPEHIKLEAQVEMPTPDSSTHEPMEISKESMATEMDFEIKTSKLEKAIEQLAEQTEQSMKKMTPNHPNSRSTLDGSLEEGDEVICENRDGSKVTGEIHRIRKDHTVATYRAEWTEEAEYLHGLWEGEVHADEPVVEVTFGGGTYAYPQSKVAKSRDTPREEDPTEDMIEVAKICPECDENFQEDSPNAIEGDDGKWYCSLECLNQKYA